MDNGLHGIITGQDIDDVCKSIYSMLKDENQIRIRCKEHLSKLDYNNDIAYNQFLEATFWGQKRAYIMLLLH